MPYTDATALYCGKDSSKRASSPNREVKNFLANSKSDMEVGASVTREGGIVFFIGWVVPIPAAMERMTRVISMARRVSLHIKVGQ